MIQVTRFVDGMFNSLLLTYQIELNFTTNIYKRFDGQWGSYNEKTGNWSGIIHSLLMGEVDIGTASLGITVERSQAVRYLPPVGAESYTLAILNPDAEDLSWVTYVNQFSNELWLILLSTSVIAAFIMWIVSEVRKHARDNVSSAYGSYCHLDNVNSTAAIFYCGEVFRPIMVRFLSELWPETIQASRKR